MRYSHDITAHLPRTLRACAAGLALSLVAATGASAADIYGGRGNDTQTIHHCGWTQNQRIDYAKQSPRNTVIIQRQLTDMGYYRAAIDGKNGPLTKAAIRKFQAENGHQLVDGIVGIETSAGLAYHSAPTPWVRACRHPNDRRTAVRYYPITAQAF